MSAWSPPFPYATDAAGRSEDGPRGWKSSIRDTLLRRSSNLPIKAPRVEFPKIAYGDQPVFRCYHPAPPRRQSPMIREELHLPQPVLVWTARGPGEALESVEVMPMILERYEHIPLGAISRDDIAAEGHRSIRAYRNYWGRVRHTNIGWRPRDLVNVFEVRPWDRGDHEFLHEWALDQLFGDWKELYPWSQPTAG